MRQGPVGSDPPKFSFTSWSSYLVNLLLQHLLGHLQVLQLHPQLLVLLLQTAPLLLHTVQLAVEPDGYVLGHLRATRECVEVIIATITSDTSEYFENIKKNIYFMAAI